MKALAFFMALALSAPGPSAAQSLRAAAAPLPLPPSFGPAAPEPLAAPNASVAAPALPALGSLFDGAGSPGQPGLFSATEEGPGRTSLRARAALRLREASRRLRLARRHGTWSIVLNAVEPGYLAGLARSYGSSEGELIPRALGLMAWAASNAEGGAFTLLAPDGRRLRVQLGRKLAPVEPKRWVAVFGDEGEDRAYDISEGNAGRLARIQAALGKKDPGAALAAALAFLDYCRPYLDENGRVSLIRSDGEVRRVRVR